MCEKIKPTCIPKIKIDTFSPDEQTRNGDPSFLDAAFNGWQPLANESAGESGVRE